MIEENTVYDLLVLGGGVVGLSILRSAQCHGWNCVLVEAESDLLSWASGSNSGIACTGVDASPGTLERALIRDSISRIREFCRDHNIPTRPCGSLVCRWPWDKNEEGGRHTLDDVLKESHDAGDTHASKLSSTEVRALEPNLSKLCLGAVHIPGEIVVDPWLFSIAYAVHAKENGANILTDWEFDADASSFDGNVWTAVRSVKSKQPSLPRLLRAKTIVNAAGLWSDILQAKMRLKFPSTPPSRYTWEGRPRRGQYRVYQANSATLIQRPVSKPCCKQYGRCIHRFKRSQYIRIFSLASQDPTNSNATNEGGFRFLESL
jgi:glycerol-3-phosphate dehydrogenase